MATNPTITRRNKSRNNNTHVNLFPTLNGIWCHIHKSLEVTIRLTLTIHHFDDRGLLCLASCYFETTSILLHSISFRYIQIIPSKLLIETVYSRYCFRSYICCNYMLEQVVDTSMKRLDFLGRWSFIEGMQHTRLKVYRKKYVVG